MFLSTNELFLLSQCAISAAYQAGQLIADYSKRTVAVQTKHGGTSLAAQVVTEVDHLSQDIILQILRQNCEIFDLGLLSEESPDDRERLNKDYFWCIDPLDGTLPFIESVPGYSVSIALVSNAGIPMLGAIYDPLTQTLYHALKNQGGWRNNQRLTRTKSRVIQQQSLVFITDKSFAQDPLYQTTLPALDRIAKALGYQNANLQLQGGAAMNACQVLNDPHACYFKFPKPQSGGGSTWDYAASACLFQEVGAWVSDIHGEPLDLNPRGSTFMNHCGVLYCANQTIAEQVMMTYQYLSQKT